MYHQDWTPKPGWQPQDLTRSAETLDLLLHECMPQLRGVTGFFTCKGMLDAKVAPKQPHMIDNEAWQEDRGHTMLFSATPQDRECMQCDPTRPTAPYRKPTQHLANP